jgi:hypothetical protein
MTQRSPQTALDLLQQLQQAPLLLLVPLLPLLLPEVPLPRHPLLLSYCCSFWPLLLGDSRSSHIVHQAGLRPAYSWLNICKVHQLLSEPGPLHAACQSRCRPPAPSQ